MLNFKCLDYGTNELCAEIRSRSLIYYLVSFSSDAHSFEFMNIDLGFGAAQYGIVASFGFTLLFAVSSLFAGPITDRYVP